MGNTPGISTGMSTEDRCRQSSPSGSSRGDRTGRKDYTALRAVRKHPAYCEKRGGRPGQGYPDGCLMRTQENAASDWPDVSSPPPSMVSECLTPLKNGFVFHDVRLGRSAAYIVSKGRKCASLGVHSLGGIYIRLKKRSSGGRKPPNSANSYSVSPGAARIYVRGDSSTKESPRGQRRGLVGA